MGFLVAPAGETKHNRLKRPFTKYRKTEHFRTRFTESLKNEFDMLGVMKERKVGRALKKGLIPKDQTFCTMNFWESNQV